MTHRGFLIILNKKKTNPSKTKTNTSTFCLSRRTNHSFFHYQMHFTVGVTATRSNNSLCSETVRRWQVREDSPTDFGNPQFGCTVCLWEYMFCAKAYALQPSLSAMQTVYTPKTEDLPVCQEGFALPFYF